jgi:hypothetical protein
MDIAAMARRLWREFVRGLAMAGMGYYPVLAMPLDESGQDNEPAVQPPAAGHPERIVPYAELTQQEREFWRQLASRIGAA